MPTTSQTYTTSTSRNTTTLSSQEILAQARYSARAQNLAQRQQRTEAMKQNRSENQRAISEARLVARTLVGSIPSALEEAAKNPLRSRKGLIVEARIPVVCEKFTSIMQSRGTLTAREQAILNQVQKELERHNYEGGTVTLTSEEFQGGYSSADGLDVVYGPCMRYFLKATVFVPKESPKQRHSQR